MPYLITAVIGYLIGTVNPAYLLGKLKGFDIRKKGSGNAGASNALILFGKTMGVVCAVFDIAKAALSVCLTAVLFPDTDTFAVATACCILGHIFPFYMSFRGGKGLACLAGAFLVLDPRVFTVALAIALVIALATRYICFIPLTASAALPVAYGILHRDLIGALLLTAVAVVIWIKHAVNLRRILEGREMRITYLWNREKETARLRKYYGDEEEKGREEDTRKI